MKDNKMKRKQYGGNPPEVCDLCQKPIANVFIDGKVRGHGWANMCKACYTQYGVPLGTGGGQEWWRDPDGNFYKIDG